LVVIVAGVVVAWVMSVLLPPSLNWRNLAALLPAVLLVVACAATLFRAPTLSWASGGLVAGAWLLAFVLLVTRYGVPAFAPEWQAQAGYRATVRALLAAQEEDASMNLIGLELPWGWHGQWDAAVRAELGAPPAESDDPPPWDVTWLLAVDGIVGSPPPASPFIVFTDAVDERSAALFAWALAAREGCAAETYGGPGYGIISAVRCPAAPTGSAARVARRSGSLGETTRGRVSTDVVRAPGHIQNATPRA
jgi:hypothetical protein